MSAGLEILTVLRKDRKVKPYGTGSYLETLSAGTSQGDFFFFPNLPGRNLENVYPYNNRRHYTVISYSLKHTLGIFG